MTSQEEINNAKVEQEKEALKQLTRDKAFKNLESAVKVMQKIDEKDCPEDLVNLANTPFERALCVEFVKFAKEYEKWKSKITSDAKWQKLIMTAIFGAVVVGLIMNALHI